MPCAQCWANSAFARVAPVHVCCLLLCRCSHTLSVSFPQSLYERACDYLELDRRVEVLNARFTVLQGMLNMLRAHIATTHR